MNKLNYVESKQVDKKLGHVIAILSIRKEKIPKYGGRVFFMGCMLGNIYNRTNFLHTFYSYNLFSILCHFYDEKIRLGRFPPPMIVFAWLDLIRHNAKRVLRGAGFNQNHGPFRHVVSCETNGHRPALLLYNT